MVRYSSATASKNQHIFEKPIERDVRRTTPLYKCFFVTFLWGLLVSAISDFFFSSSYATAFLISPKKLKQKISGFNIHMAKQILTGDGKKSSSSIIIIPPSYPSSKRSNITLRQYLTDPSGTHLAMAPAFFGFYAYFGALSVLDDELQVLFNQTHAVTGASAGAMAAILISAGIKPRHAAEFSSRLTLWDFADPVGIGGLFKGDKFEGIMRDYLVNNMETDELMEDTVIPVAVTGFDLMSMSESILKSGSMAKAARASACFPGLFQPASFYDGDANFPSGLLVDGGITDGFGCNGLNILPGINKRIVNLVVGSFGGSTPPGPSVFSKASSVLSISIQNTPRCGPWAMENGRKAAHAAKESLKAVLDEPLWSGEEENHYILQIDAARFIPE